MTNNVNLSSYTNAFICEGFTQYTTPTMSGRNLPTNDIGGLFGWLLWSRYNIQDPPVGNSYDTYIKYTKKEDFLRDVNAIGNSTTYSLVPYSANPGATYCFFYSNIGETVIQPTYPIGNDFLHVINLLSYNMPLVIAGSTTGIADYNIDNSNPVNIVKTLVGQTGDAARAKFLETTPNIFGIFPSINNGMGLTALPFDTLFGATTSVQNPATGGATVANRIVNVYGNGSFNIDSRTWLADSSLKATLNLTSDIAGTMAKAALTSGGVYFSPTGPSNKPLGNMGIASIVTNTTTQSTLRQNRVNYFIAANGDKFLGSDLVGATANTDSSYANKDRIAPNYSAETIERSFTSILSTFIGRQNNSALRSEVSTALQNILYSLAQLTSTFEQILIVCDGSNNTDNSATLRVDVSLTPITATGPGQVNINGTNLVIVVEGMG